MAIDRKHLGRRYGPYAFAVGLEHVRDFASATGGGTLSYQWRKNGVNMANGTFSGRATVSGATTTARAAPAIG